MVSTDSLSNLKQSHSNSWQVFFSRETPCLKRNYTVKTALVLCTEKAKQLKPKARPQFLNQTKVNKQLGDKSHPK